MKLMMVTYLDLRYQKFPGMRDDGDKDYDVNFGKDGHNEVRGS